MAFANVNLSRRQRRALSFYDDSIANTARLSYPPVSVSDLLNFSSNVEHNQLQTGILLYKILPVRLATRIIDIHDLPYICGINPFMQFIHNDYVNVFMQMKAIKHIKTQADLSKFNTLMIEGLKQGNSALPQLARASKELAPHLAPEVLNRFINRFITCRIGRRLLAEQHLAIIQQHLHPQPHSHLIGVIDHDVNIRAVIKATYKRAFLISRDVNGLSPHMDLNIEQTTALPYVVRHIQYILLEIFKNAIRATAERAIRDSTRFLDEDDIPQVQVTVHGGPSETTIIVSDKGGGISQDHQDRVFDFAFSTAQGLDAASLLEQPQGVGDYANRPMAGEGFGLPMARAYARFFGGDISFQTMQDHGTDVYIKLRHVDLKGTQNILPV
ncbi:uncharacterized protein MONBRDRAFT_5845 [Monosiga brevicollis MX1]|uniref:Protein-serine/threonine kinase n=1 Tax=Monosiga brevicollis TaxID=81824 RepID=A9USM8_MONBE|nr:uncharacterized protein MONBRDRAFT_5845 [Monosiga brevicollis MX1]EDQ92129.1 predicted protein [Monosiga brevicollis MX1]|eukprot:XP_001743415.1 hypothetical protein [Monosiga brevicollis MX1]